MAESKEVKQWVGLVAAKEDARQSQMTTRYNELAGLSEDERIKQITDMARAEHELDEDKLHIFTNSRLQTWVKMDADKAEQVARAYDEAMKNLPGTLAMRRVGAVQTVTRDLDTEQVERLYELLPSLLKENPRAVISSLGSSADKKPRPATKRKRKFLFF
ncbi:MAG: hypothetical protein DK304_000121 [Chloroflexi bacterium]|jgi:hypothetical protein|nr:MAG: hypothetical protein DK304_000121 [Chloroflexota bacterium]